MPYVNVVLGLPVEGPFDYLVPENLDKKIPIGARVFVNFRNKKEVAYVVGLSNKTKIKKIKEVISLIDTFPIVDEKMLELCGKLSQYYCCSLGEAIETALPDDLRKGRLIKNGIASSPELALREIEGAAIRFIQGANRLSSYLEEIKKVFESGCSVIVLFSDIAAARLAQNIIRRDLGAEAIITYRKQPDELKVWEQIRSLPNCIVAGMRSAVFSPVKNLGLIIADDEANSVYKQEQSPHYNTREVALMRARIDGARVILGANALSLESIYLAQKEGIKYETLPSQKNYPEIKVIDPYRQPYAQRKDKSVFTKFLLDSIYSVLEKKGKVLLVINRKGFATSASCHNCAVPLKCPRCNINLVFHFDGELLKCHHCNFQMPSPKICPNCKAGYIQFSGIGTEKVESELARIFPQAKLNEDIFVSTSAALKHAGLDFGLIGVLAVDNLLNRVDFRAAEKTFSLIFSLTALTSQKIIIQSANINHYCFQALLKNDPGLFYSQELKQRGQLGFPPFRHIILIRIRGIEFEKVKKTSGDLFEKLREIKTASLKILSLNPGQPAKLRGNFYFQILISATDPVRACNFLKLHLHERHNSGIIISVDVDPV